MRSNESKGQPRASAELRSDDDHTALQSHIELYEQLSRINNELVNTQRQLVQKNLDLEKLAAENARLYAEAQELLQMQNGFLAILTHDLKTPLSAITGYAQLLTRRVARDAPPHSTKLLAGLQEIEAAAAKMTEQVNGLLEIARLKRGEALPLHLEPVDLVALLQQVSTALEVVSMQPRISVDTAVPSLVGQWDVSQLERLLTNLLSNAIKYSPDDSNIMVEVTVEEDPAAPPAHAVVRVRDQGVGIPASDLPHIFEPFSRAQNTIGRIAGTGLGLFSARQIVEQHGGTIAVESEVGAGTVFTVYLPLPVVQPSSR